MLDTPQQWDPCGFRDNKWDPCGFEDFCIRNVTMHQSKAVDAKSLLSTIPLSPSSALPSPSTSEASGSTVRRANSVPCEHLPVRLQRPLRTGPSVPANRAQRPLRTRPSVPANRAQRPLRTRPSVPANKTFGIPKKLRNIRIFDAYPGNVKNMRKF